MSAFLATCHCLDELTIADDGWGSVLAFVVPWVVIGIVVWCCIWHWFWNH